MAFQLSPGVSVSERDLTTIVPAVATTNAAFAGLFSWGPVDKIVLVDSENNLVKTFGLPTDENHQYFFSAANFLSYGNNLSVVRCLGNNTLAKNAGPTGTGILIRNTDWIGSAGMTSHGPFIARYPGSLGNSLRVEIYGATSGYTDWQYANEFSTTPTTSSSLAGLGGSNDEFHLVVVDRDGEWTGLTGTVIEKFEGLSVYTDAQDSNGLSKFFRTRINEDSQYIVCPTDVTIDSTATLSNMKLGTTASTHLNFASVSYPAGGTGAYSLFTLARYDFAYGRGETSPSEATFPGYTDIAFGSGYTSGGYDLFKDPETIDVNLIIGGPETQNISTTWDSASSVAQLIKDRVTDVRKDCVLFCSSPISDPYLTETQKYNIAKAYRDDIGSSSYVFIDSGYKYMYDIYNDVYRWVPLCGDIAGICARSDSTNDPWYSPAGFNRGQVKGVAKLAFNPSATFRDNLYKNNINPVVTFTNEGTILYGDKTAQTKPSAFDRLNVRRLFIVLEKAIATAAKYSLFEFNDAFTRAQFRSLVEPFLRDVQARRGITDFKVVCDEKNNTAEVIDSNRFVADIYIKPARSINFIQLNFIATRTGVSFSEVGA